MTVTGVTDAEQRGLRRGWWPAALGTAAVLAVFAASRLAIVGVASEREYDEGVYLLSARALAAGEQLFTQVFSSQPPAFLESLALLLRVAGDNLANAQLFSLAWALLAMAATAAVARRVAGTAAAPLGAAALAVGPTFTALAHTVQAEVPSIALAMSSMVLALPPRGRPWTRGRLFASGTVFGLALLFKLFAAPLALPVVLLLLVRDEGDGRPWTLDLRGFLPRAIAWGLGVATVLVLPLLVYDARALYEQTVAFHIAKLAAYRSTPIVNVGRAWTMVEKDTVVSVAAAAGIVLLFVRNRLAAAWLGIWAAAMLLVIRKQTPLFWRHLVLLSPPLALLAACAFALPLARMRGLPRAFAVTIAILAMAVPAIHHPDNARALIPPLPHPSWMPWPPMPRAGVDTAPALSQTADWIRKHTAADELVGGDDPIVIYLADRRAPGQLCDTSLARIQARSLTLDAAIRNSARARVLVMRKGGRLGQLEGFGAWLAANYERQDPRSIDIGPGRNVWIRRGDAAAAAAAAGAGWNVSLSAKP